MPVISPTLALIVALVLCVTHAAVGWKAYDLGKDAVYSERYKMEEVERRVLEATDKSITKNLSEMEVKNVYTTQKLEKEVVEVPVYRDCEHTDAAFGVLNDSLTAPEDRHEQPSGVVVPKTDTTGG